MGKNEKNSESKEIKEVAALKYSPSEDRAPKIVALGKGEIAQKILELAKDSNVAVYHDEKLAHTLNKLQVGDEIPRELYEVIAEVLVFVSNLDRRYGEKYGRKK